MSNAERIEIGECQVISGEWDTDKMAIFKVKTQQKVVGKAVALEIEARLNTPARAQPVSGRAVEIAEAIFKQSVKEWEAIGKLLVSQTVAANIIAEALQAARIEGVKLGLEAAVACDSESYYEPDSCHGYGDGCAMEAYAKEKAILALSPEEIGGK